MVAQLLTELNQVEVRRGAWIEKQIGHYRIPSYSARVGAAGHRHILLSGRVAHNIAVSNARIAVNHKEEEAITAMQEQDFLNATQLSQKGEVHGTHRCKM